MLNRHKAWRRFRQAFCALSKALRDVLCHLVEFVVALAFLIPPEILAAVLLLVLAVLERLALGGYLDSWFRS
jgi:hypothetical protein